MSDNIFNPTFAKAIIIRSELRAKFSIAQERANALSRKIEEVHELITKSDPEANEKAQRILERPIQIGF